MVHIRLHKLEWTNTDRHHTKLIKFCEENLLHPTVRHWSTEADYEIVLEENNWRQFQKETPDWNKL